MLVGVYSVVSRLEWSRTGIDGRISDFKVLVELISSDLRVETQALIDVDTTLHVSALVHNKITFFIVSAVSSVNEWRDPGSLCLQGICTFLAGMNETAAASLDCEKRVEDGVKGPC